MHSIIVVTPYPSDINDVIWDPTSTVKDVTCDNDTIVNSQGRLSLRRLIDANIEYGYTTFAISAHV